jgi:uncharacterized protein
MTHPIPDAALDDRIAFVGTAGAGKTYAAMTAVERLLDRGARVVIPDALGVWYGLRLKPNGTDAAYEDVAVFGGPHGDVPITEHAGALVGETIAGMRESCIVDLSTLGTKAAERRFMLAMLTSLYRQTLGEPVHLIFDEADMWAPQKLLDRDGDSARLLGQMETIVRRGRVKGFIPWLITQRPAVLSKDVLSQADGLIAMKLTASQDRNAIGAWIEGQADVQEGKAILASLPTMKRGQGVVWIPSRGILSTEQFPAKATFDSSRTPKRGETKRDVKLTPINIEAVREKLATVEAQAIENDPKRLKAIIADLQKKVDTKPAPVSVTVTDPAVLESEYRRGKLDGHAAGYTRGVEQQAAYSRQGFEQMVEAVAARVGERLSGSVLMPADEVQASYTPPAVKPRVAAPVVAPQPVVVANGFTDPQARIIRSLSMWKALGHDQPTRIMVGAGSGYSHSSGGFKNLLGGLRSGGYIDYPKDGLVRLLADPVAMDPTEGRDRLLGILNAPQRKIFDAVYASGEVSREELGAATDYSPTSGGFKNLLGGLRSLGILEYPSTGRVKLADWILEIAA